MQATCLAGVFFLVAPALATASTLKVSVVGASTKRLPGEIVTGVPGATVKAARNEFEAFQLVVTGSALTGVRVSASPLAGPAGAVIPASQVRLYREGYLDLATASTAQGGTGRWPDPLVPDVDEIYGERRNAFPFDVPDGENRVVFVDLQVPANVPAGLYTGQLTVSAAGGLTQAVPIRLTVWDFELPSTSTLKSYYGMWGDQVCRAHLGAAAACQTVEGVTPFTLLYGRFLLNHRMSGAAVYHGPAAAGSGYDWSAFDRTYGALFDGSDPVTLLRGARLTTIPYRLGRTAPEYAAWAQHFRAKGWFDRTFDYTCDEPGGQYCAWSSIPPRADAVHGGDPAFRTLVTTSIANATQNRMDGYINIIVPTVQMMDDKPGSPNAGNQRSTYDAFLKASANNQLWLYQACDSHGCGGYGGPSDTYHTNWPDYTIDDSAVQNRSMEWMSFLYRASGELYWEVADLLPTAWSSVYDFGGNGDGTFLYPGTPALIGGTTDVPVASLRMKMIREGMEDYEYLHLVSALGDDAYARRVAQTLFPSMHDALKSESALMAAREQLALRILQLTPHADALSYSAASTNAKVTVDGELSEFAAAPSVTLSGAQAGSAAIGTAKLVWDQTRLYLGFSVADSLPLINEGGRDGNVWNGSGIELMLDTRKARRAQPGPGDYHLLVNAKGDLRDEAGGASGWDASWTSGAVFTVKPTATGYDVELAIPWASLGVTPTTGFSMGLDLAVNDEQASGTVLSFDWAGLTHFGQPDGWGTLTLGGANVPPNGGGGGSPAGGCQVASGEGSAVPLAILSVALLLVILYRRRAD